MSLTLETKIDGQRLPTHLDLPNHLGTYVCSSLVFPQNDLLYSSIFPVLVTIHPNGRFQLIAGKDVRNIAQGAPTGYRAADFVYLPGKITRQIADPSGDDVGDDLNPIVPTLLVEYVSHDPREVQQPEEFRGYFWAYGQGVHSQFYATYEPTLGLLALKCRINGHYELVEADQYGHFPIPPMCVALGTRWNTHFHLTWQGLRFFSPGGQLLLSSTERLDRMRELGTEHMTYEALEQERSRTDAAMAHVDVLRSMLRALGVDPDQV